MSIYPGAIFTPTGWGGHTPRRKGQRGVLHVAVSDRADLPPWNENTWHFYVNKAGQVHQYVDTEFCAWANVDANGDAVSIESQGGVVNPNGELWTPEQAHAIAGVIRWVHDTEGTPIELLPDSKLGRRGWGPHRLGIDPWRVAGGQSWSGSRGKVCPGDAKIGQIPGILADAAGGAPTPTPVPQPTPQPGRVPPPRLNFPFGNQYVGDRKGPAASHGGYYAGERPFVANVQAWLIYHGCVPGVADWQASNWDDGLFDAPWSTNAAATWHDRFYPGQPYRDRIYADDYDRLARP